MLFVGNPLHLRLSLTCCIAAKLKPNHRFRSENLDNYHRMEKGLYAENASHIPGIPLKHQILSLFYPVITVTILRGRFLPVHRQ